LQNVVQAVNCEMLAELSNLSLENAFGPLKKTLASLKTGEK